MLTLIDDYCAQSNNYGYTVMRDTGKTNKKTGEPVRVTLGYVGRMKAVLELVKKDMLHRRIELEDVELNEALRFVKEQTDRILMAMTGIEL